MPELLARSAGIRTLYLPEASTWRNGFSRTVGTWAILVYGGVGHSPAGGLTTPTKTMFQLAPVQLRHSVLREIHCCWGPAPTLPSMRSSDIQPPLAHPFFWWSTMSPRTCMRRKGTACETAHCIVPPAGVTEKPSAAFQKVQVALLFGRVASERTPPAMWTSSGEAPSPRTCV